MRGADFESLVDRVRAHAAADPAALAFRFLSDRGRREEELSRGELDVRARCFAGALQELSRPGDRVILLFPPGLAYVSAFLGCLYAGRVAVPLYPPRTHQKHFRIRGVLDDSGAQVALTEEKLLPALERHLDAEQRARLRLVTGESLAADAAATWHGPTLAPDTLAFLQYTSGSTSTPKGVRVTHGNLMANQAAIAERFASRASDLCLNWLPLYHDMGLIGTVLHPLYVGYPSILMPALDFLRQPFSWLEAIGRYRATVAGAPNFAYERLWRRATPGQLEGLDLASWRVAFNGAEPVRSDTLERFAATFAPAGLRREALYPCYGLAEATLFVTGGDPRRPPATRTLPGGKVLVSCGWPASGHEVRVVDPERGSRLDDGEVGEIWVAGPSVADGYWGRPEASAGDSGVGVFGVEGRFLRTGDLGFLANGELYVTGRLKELLILRGRNHYPQDLELTAEASHPDLEPGAGAAVALELGGEERLVLVHEVARRATSTVEARVEARVEEVAEAVRRAVAERHEVQVHAVVLLRHGALLRTSSGKVRRRACGEAWLAGELRVVGESVLGGDPVEPEGVAERSTAAELAELAPEERRAWLLAWLESCTRELFDRREPLEPEVPLTAQGLDSLLAVELEARIDAELGLSAPFSRWLEGGTLAAAAVELARQVGEGAAPEAAGEDEPAGEAPATGVLSHGQRALWFLQRLAPASAAYHVSFAARAPAGFDIAALGRALHLLRQRHPQLCATFHAAEGGAVRRPEAEDLPWLEVTEAAGWSPGELTRALDEAVHRPIDLASGPVLRAHVFRDAPRRGGADRPGDVLLLVIHHAVVDLWSLVVLVSELGELYPEPRPLAAPAPYDAWVARQARRLAGPRGAVLAGWWRRQLDGAPTVLELPADRPRPPVQSFRGATVPCRLGRAAARLASEGRTTLFSVLLSAFRVHLGRLTGRHDFLIGAPFAGRGERRFHGTVGYFVNPLPLRGDLAAVTTFADALEQSAAAVRGALEHQEMPAALLVEELAPERDPSRNPLFQAQLVLEKPHRPALGEVAPFLLGQEGGRLRLGGLELESVAVPRRAAQLDLTLTLVETSRGLDGLIEYSTDLFDRTTVHRLARQLGVLLGSAAADPGRRWAELDWMSAGERHQSRVEWRGAPLSAGGEDTLLHELFEARVGERGDEVAVEGGGLRWTYAELDARAGGVARALRAAGVGREERVGVFLERSPWMVAALLGVLKSGAAYLPLDPAYPAERLRFTLDDAGARVVLSAASLRGRRPDFPGRWLEVDELAPQSGVRGPGGSPRHLAYAIYTSGSTGRPKGVAIEHRSAVARVRWALRAFPAATLERTLAATSICFDLSVFEIFVPLAAGATVVVVENALHAAGSAATLLNTVPSALRELTRRGALPRTLRAVNLAGEPLARELVDAAFAQPGVEAVLNLYGPSEDTTYSTIERLRPGGGKPAVGRPVDATRLGLLDRHGRPVAVGVHGEICLGGAGLARGYLGRPAQTAERFTPDAMSGELGERLYRTGDLARFLTDGRVDLLGRLDHQVKIRGFRIELDEIAAALRALEGVGEAVVVVLRGALDEPRLVAYLTPAGGVRPIAAELTAALRRTLPDYMVPATCVVLDALPLLPNGKIDRRALPAPSGERPDQAVVYAPPSTPRERELAALWAEVLGLDRVGVDDNFFDLGGHSLLMMEAHRRLEERQGRTIPVVELFRSPTVRSLARRLDGEEDGGQDGAAPTFDAVRQRAERKRRRPRARPRPNR